MKVKVFLMVLVSLVLASCGNNNKKTEEEENQTVELKPYEKKVKGYLSDVFEIVDGTYKIEIKRRAMLEGKIQVKIKSIGKGDSKDYGFHDGNYGPLYLTICNKEGQPIANFEEMSSSYEADALLKDMASKVGEENWILFDNSFLKDTIPAEAATFIITSKQIEETQRGVNSSDDESSSENESDELSSISGTEDWDSVLDDYEEYTDKFLAMMEKINKDDNIDALMDYPELMEKAKDLEKSLNKAKKSNSLSSKQLKRMVEIQVKLLNAASKMDKMQ